MGGRPIRANERLSTSGHSACTARRAEMRISFERGKLTAESNDWFFSSIHIFVSFDFSHNLKTQRVMESLLYMGSIAHVCIFKPLIVIVEHYQYNCQKVTAVSFPSMLLALRRLL